MARGQREDKSARAAALGEVAGEPDATINIHFVPQSTRCGVGLGRYVIESRIETSFADDVKLMLRAIGKSEDLFQEEHISSAGKCLASEACTANLEEQIGPKATWRRDGTSEIARKLYESDPEYDEMQDLLKKAEELAAEGRLEASAQAWAQIATRSSPGGPSRGGAAEGAGVPLRASGSRTVPGENKKDH